MVKIYPNAKLNLMLRIVDRLPTGYHLLEMINVPINLYDEITIKPDKEFSQTFYPPIDCKPEKTTIFKAYELLKKWVGEINLSVTIKKGIPTGAGMGGGSSDAGFFIKYILEQKKIKLDRKTLDEIANKVGADVPFFLYNKPALIKGIGEKVIPFKKFPNLHFLILVPDFTISTAWAYSNVKLPLTKNKHNSILNISEINEVQLTNLMENDLEKVVETEFPVIREIKSFLIDMGAKKAMMTGSGSAVFGIFKDKSFVNKASLEAKKVFKSYKIFTCETLGA